MSDDDPFKVVDSSGLTDADWAALNKLKEAYANGGKKRLDAEMAKLAEKDAARLVAVIGAMYPDVMRDAIRDHMAEEGITEDDLREIASKPPNPRRYQ